MKIKLFIFSIFLASSQPCLAGADLYSPIDLSSCGGAIFGASTQSVYGQNSYSQNSYSQNNYSQNTYGQNGYNQNNYNQPGYNQSGNAYGVNNSGTNQTSAQLATGTPNFGQTANALAPAQSGCPFMDQAAGPSSDIAQIQNYIHDLSTAETNGSGSAACAAVKSAAQSADRAIDNNLRNNLNLELPNIQSGGLPNCSNYETLLTVERSNATAAVASTTPSSMSSYSSPNPYSVCGQFSSVGTIAVDPNCVQTTYMNRLTCAARICSDNSATLATNSRNQALRDDVQTLATNAEALITSSNGCTNDAVLGSVLKSSIATLSTIGAISATSPMGGTAIALGGRLLNAMVTRFLSGNTAQTAWSKLVKENELQKMQCVYMLSLRNSLACDQLELEGITTSSSNEIASCEQYFDDDSRALGHSLVNLNAIAQAVNLKNGADPTADTDSLDQLGQVMQSKVGDQNFHDFLGKLKQNLLSIAQNPSAPNRSRSAKLAEAIGSFLTNFDKMNALLAQGKAIDPDTAKALNASVLKALASGETLSATVRLALAETGAQNYASIDLLAGNLEATHAADRGAAQIRTALAQIRGAASRNADEAHDALLRVIQKQFGDRLQEVGQRFLVNRDKQSENDTRNDAEYLLASCTLNTGAFFFQPPGGGGGIPFLGGGEKSDALKARNNLKEPGEAYKKACEPVYCSGVAPRPPSISAGPLAFRKYQCDLINRFPDYRKGLYEHPKLECTK